MTPEAAIASLLADRGPDKTICPSEAARLLADEAGEWHKHMNEVHDAARSLASRGEIALSWKGRTKTAPDGPYRIASPG